MGPVVAVQRCFEYNIEEVLRQVEWLYDAGDGPDPSGKKILLKPNILSDDDPIRGITTHPVVVEAVILFLQSRGATVFVGDSPTFDNRNFTGEKSGIRQVVEKCGATWVRFNDESVSRMAGLSEIKITALIDKVDLIISLPKLKNHELMVLSGAIKNIFGFVPGFNKARQHVRYPDRYRFAGFFVDLEEAVRPDFHIMDGIIALEGPGPGNGYPKKVNVLMASVNPLALDIVASRIIGYDPLMIPTNRIALERGRLPGNIDDIVVRGADPEAIVVADFKRIERGGEAGIIFKFLKRRLPVIRRLSERPVFNHRLCTGCASCIEICPVNILSFDGKRKNSILVNEAQCIHCYCCQEVCREGAIEIKRKII